LHDCHGGIETIACSPAFALACRGGDDRALSDAEPDGAYRFLGNAKDTPDAIHMRPSRRRHRVAAHRDVLVAHNTTELELGDDPEREGLRRPIRPSLGFYE
jgi:hypothetical protein